MKLTSAQDALMNAVVSNLQMIYEFKDGVVGHPFTRADVQRLAKVAYDDINALWQEIGYSNQPQLGYGPCPWGANHVILPVAASGGEHIACTNNGCPIKGVEFTRFDWGRRDV